MSDNDDPTNVVPFSRPQQPTTPPLDETDLGEVILDDVLVLSEEQQGHLNFLMGTPEVKEFREITGNVFPKRLQAATDKLLRVSHNLGVLRDGLLKKRNELIKLEDDPTNVVSFPSTPAETNLSNDIDVDLDDIIIFTPTEQERFNFLLETPEVQKFREITGNTFPERLIGGLETIIKLTADLKKYRDNLLKQEDGIDGSLEP